MKVIYYVGNKVYIKMRWKKKQETKGQQKKVQENSKERRRGGRNKHSNLI